MRISIKFLGFLFLITAIKAKSVIHLDEFFKDFPIDSSTGKNYFRVPAYTEGGMVFVFKVYKPHPEIDLDFRFTPLNENSTDDDIINSPKWVSLMPPSIGHSFDEYDIYYIYQSFQTTYKNDVGVYISSNQDCKMSFSIRGNGYVFPITMSEETIIEDIITGYYLKVPVEGGENLSLVVKVYRPVEKFDFTLWVSQWKTQNQTDYEIRRNWPDRKDLKEFIIQDDNDFMIFRYPFYAFRDTKSLAFYFVSSQHYKIGFYLDKES